MFLLSERLFMFACDNKNVTEATENNESCMSHLFSSSTKNYIWKELLLE